jgi:LPPG:FO 2-phospho-L-lactate transferase
VIVALAGGVGGAKLAQGLMRAVPSGDLTVIVNTADDFELFGLNISPDLDTVLYTLAGIANPMTGWGIADDTSNVLDQLGRYGHDRWFTITDRDFATHIHRTLRLREGATLTDVAVELARRLTVPANVLPMTDDPVATIVRTPIGDLPFQDYFVRRRQQDDVLGVTFRGVESARLPPGVVATLTEAELIVICPSNPLVSIGPILAIPGMRDALDSARAPIVAVSPLVGGKAIKGPADKMLTTMGHESSALGVARLYAGLMDGFVIDQLDADQRELIERQVDVKVLVTQTVMGGISDRERLAREILAFGATLRRPVETTH